MTVVKASVFEFQTSTSCQFWFIFILLCLLLSISVPFLNFIHFYFFTCQIFPLCPKQKKWEMMSCFLTPCLIWFCRQTPWNFHEVDCVEPNVPMVDICSFKPECRIKENIFCNDIRSMRYFLHAFSSMQHDKHCLAFAFTYREMSDFQGIAWIKVRKSPFLIFFWPIFGPLQRIAWTKVSKSPLFCLISKTRHFKVVDKYACHT